MGSQIKVLFLCTGNCCRSQMAEALLKHVGGEGFRALSAGSHPAGYIHPLATLALEHHGVPIVDQRSKSWDEFADEGVDLVITLCDTAAALACPVWLDAPLTVHWMHPDPVALAGTDGERIRFAEEVAGQLKGKIEQLVALDFENSLREELLEALNAIGR